MLPVSIGSLTSPVGVQILHVASPCDGIHEMKKAFLVVNVLMNG